MLSHAGWDQDAGGSGTFEDSLTSKISCHILLTGGSAAKRQKLAGMLLQLLISGKPGGASILSLPLMLSEGDGDPVQGLLKMLPGSLHR